MIDMEYLKDARISYQNNIPEMRMQKGWRIKTSLIIIKLFLSATAWTEQHYYSLHTVVRSSKWEKVVGFSSPGSTPTSIAFFALLLLLSRVA